MFKGATAHAPAPRRRADAREDQACRNYQATVITRV